MLSWISVRGSMAAKPRHSGISFPKLCRHLGFAEPVPEYRFAPPRRWRFDYAFVKSLVAVEVEGGVFARVQGRHARGAGYRADLEKYNTAASLGWRVLRVLPEQLEDAQTWAYLKACGV